MKNLIILFIASLIFSHCKDTNTNNGSTDSNAASVKANAFFDKTFDEEVDRNPQMQARLGIKKDYSKWNDLSEENAHQEIELAKKTLQTLKDSVQLDQLDPTTKVSYQLFKKRFEDRIANHAFRHNDYPVNQMFGTQSEVPAFLINMHKVDNEDDAQAYINRLEATTLLFDQLIRQLKIREKKNVIPPKFVFNHVISDAKNVMKGFPFDKSGRDNVIYADFTKKVNELKIGKKKKEALINEAQKKLMSNVRGAYTSLISYLEELEKKATEDDGVWKFNNGAPYFQHQLKRITTTNYTADEIHNIGLKEVERIHNEMRAIMKQVKFEGDLAAFFDFMRNDQQFYYPNDGKGKEAYMVQAKKIIDDMRDKLDDLFLTKPKAKMIVKAVEAFREKSAGKAFYETGTPDGKRPGIYYANTYDMEAMPKYQMEALAYHEGIPGHHMQLSIAQEMETLPKFRRYSGDFTAYIEGWALYTEFLPKEFGFYSDPYSDFGRLAMELWRACRLVVDTGIHSKKWTRQQGIDYYKDNTPNALSDCIKMVERHVVMPGQATAYKIGMIKILELREKAKSALKDKFDIRKFHDVVLVNGALPLDILEQLVDEYIAKEQKAG